MRICILAHTDSPWTPYYAGFLRRAGHDISVISFSPQTLEGVACYYVGSRKADGRLPKWLYLWRVPAIRALLRKIQPEVVLATYVQSNGLLGALTKCSALVVSSRGADHEWGLPRFLRDPLARWIGSRAEIIHASSPELVESLASTGIPREKCVVIPLGTDASVFVPRAGPRPPGPPRIICTRKHDPLYDNDTIVRALGILRDEGFSFECRFVGEGPTRARTEELARALRLSDRIEFLGEVKHTGIPFQLRWADIYASAARSDGAPSSLFEAMSSALFPVVSDIRANRDWLDHGVTGYLCRVGSATEFAQGMRFAWSSAEVVARAVALNRRTVIERLDRNAGLAELEKLLARAVQIHRAPTD